MLEMFVLFVIVSFVRIVWAILEIADEVVHRFWNVVHNKKGWYDNY